MTFQEFYEDWAPRQLWVPSTRANADLAVGSVGFGDLPTEGDPAIPHRDVGEVDVGEVGADDDQDAVRDRALGVPSRGRGPRDRRRSDRRRRAAAATQGRGGDADPDGGAGRAAVAHADSSRVSTRHGFRAYVALCAFAGLRKGEAAGVQVGDIDFALRRLAVSRQLQRDGDSFAVRLPKYGSERVVHLPDELVEMLRSHVEDYLPEEPHGRWLFTVGDGPMYDNDIDWRWRATRTSAGLPHVRLHDLRHFYARG